MKVAISPTTSVRTLRNGKKPTYQPEETMTRLENSIYQSLAAEGYEVDRQLLRERAREVTKALGKSKQLEKIR
jgi:hypothetical protein